MRKTYISTMAAYEKHRRTFPTHLTTHWLALYDPKDPQAKARWESAGRPVAVSTELVHEGIQDQWEYNPQVTVLPHPIFEGRMLMQDVMDKEENADNVHNGVQHVLQDARNIGIEATDTIMHVHRKLGRWHPGFRLRMHR